MSCSTQRCPKCSGLIVIVAVAEPFLVGGTRFSPSKKGAIVAV